MWGRCGDRMVTGPPLARTQVIYVNLRCSAISGSIHLKGDLASWGNELINVDAGRGGAVLLNNLQGYRGHSKVRTRTAVESYGRASPRSTGPP